MVFKPQSPSSTEIFTSSEPSSQTPVGIAEQYGVLANFLKIGVMGNQAEVTRFVDACRNKIEPQDVSKIEDVLVLGKIFQMALKLKNPPPSSFSVEEKFYKTVDAAKFARAWILATGSDAAILSGKKPDDEIRIRIDPSDIDRFGTTIPRLKEVAEGALHSMNFQKAEGANMLILITTPADFLRNIVSTSSGLLHPHRL